MTSSRGASSRRVAALVRKELRQLLRDRSNLLMGLALPIVLILLFGYGMTFDVRDARVALVMEDRSPEAADVVAGLALSRHITPTLVNSMRDAERRMADRKADAIVRIPQDFSRRLAAGKADIQVLTYGVDANHARTIQSYVEQALALWQARQADRRGAAHGAAGFVVLEPRLWFNAANTSTWFLVPGLIVIIITLVGAFLTALVMAREWERGTLEALFVTPVRPMEILLAKTIPYFCVGLIGLLMSILAARFLFGVPLHGSLGALLLASVLYLLVALGLGLCISSVTRNQFVASQVALLASFMPALMLSGFLFDLRNMPAVVAGVGHVLPATYYLELLKSIFLSGDFWPMILRNCAVLLLYAIVLMALAHRRTRKHLE